MSMTRTSALNHILIGIDDSLPAKWAMQAGMRLASQVSARVMLIHVVQPTTAAIGDSFAMDEKARAIDLQFGKELLSHESALFALPATVETRLCTGFPADEITGVARDWRADWIVIGTHSRCHLAQFVLGSTAEAVIRLSPCPVITVAHAPRQSSVETNGRLENGNNPQPSCDGSRSSHLAASERPKANRSAR